ncbi:MAG: hypothetical protein KGN36_15825 [Acidobacteriota bacterium]|nr:hypothetical protein [Acidobacteriota bacterium]
MTLALRAVRVAAGFGLLFAGAVLALPGVPGPGIPIMLCGLVLLSSHFAWARRALDWVKARASAVRRRIQTGSPGGNGGA